ncbi:uncharacterized protein TNCT_113551 [Trichonephila clavata]|uniref:PiggyBac transposable element-derived protein domain-containing protein n=1 Tax=Trichonephila clavata TaxID=2740835 RepID=A0A8X6KCV5_TRICU|nr:uncharacterized protein TNCT_113551 [Trichonephila clavata]
MSKRTRQSKFLEDISNIWEEFSEFSSDGLSKFFFNILDLAGINTWILYKQTTGYNISRQDFLLKLAVELAADFREARGQPKEKTNSKRSLPKSTTDANQRKRCQIV